MYAVICVPEFTSFRNAGSWFTEVYCNGTFLIPYTLLVTEAWATLEVLVPVSLRPNLVARVERTQTKRVRSFLTIFST